MCDNGKFSGYKVMTESDPDILSRLNRSEFAILNPGPREFLVDKAMVSKGDAMLVLGLPHATDVEKSRAVELLGYAQFIADVCEPSVSSAVLFLIAAILNPGNEQAATRACQDLMNESYQSDPVVRSSIIAITRHVMNRVNEKHRDELQAMLLKFDHRTNPHTDRS